MIFCPHAQIDNQIVDRVLQLKKLFIYSVERCGDFSLILIQSYKVVSVNKYL